MGWRGIAIGGYVGSLFGGPLGAILGAALGHTVEKRMSGGDKSPRDSASFQRVPPRQRSQIFCASAAAMFAKMAKADGRITRDEIDCVENAFRRLGFSPAARNHAVDAFRRAKNDEHTIYEYAEEFAAVVDSVDVRELLYELLWDLAGADGVVGPEERAILQRIPHALHIRAAWYSFFAARQGGAPSSRDSLADAYAVLGAQPADDADELKRKYRELAKRNHPDALRAQGLPEEMIGKATERMSRINEAWSAIRSARGI